MEAALWALIGTLVGAVTSILTTWISARNASALQGAASRLDREEQHRLFQRSTLIELQEAIHDLLRLSARGYLEDEAAFKKTGVWGRQPLSVDLNEDIRVGIREVIILRERISDDALRRDLQRINELIGGLALPRTRSDAEELFSSLMGASTPLMEHIGTVLRSQYADHRSGSLPPS